MLMFHSHNVDCEMKNRKFATATNTAEIEFNDVTLQIPGSPFHFVFNLLSWIAEMKQWKLISTGAHYDKRGSRYEQLFTMCPTLIPRTC